MSRRATIAALGVASLAATAPAAHALGRPGDLDPTFNVGTPVPLEFSRAAPRSTFIDSVIVDPQGRLLVSGGASDANGKNAGFVGRLSGAGVLDTTFGDQGSRILQFGGGAGTYRPYSFAQALFTAPNGRVGSVIYRIKADERRDIAVAELLDSGSLDLDFGAAGLATRDLASAPADTNPIAGVAGPDGSVYVSGTLNPVTSGKDRQVTLTKFSAAGQLVTSFGDQAGTRVDTFSQYAGDKNTSGGQMVMLPNNKLLMAGGTYGADGRQAMFLARYSMLDGTPDPAFGTKPGYTVVQARDPSLASGDSSSTGLTVGGDGSIYVAGGADDAQRKGAMLLIKFSPSGERDFTFANNGIKRLQLAEGTDYYHRSYAGTVLLQPDGKILLVGTSDADLSTSEGVVARLRTDGTLDPTFGTDGVVRLQLAPTGGAARETFVDRAVLLGGQLVVAGATSQGGAAQGFITRILLAPLPDPVPAPPAGGGALAPGPTGASGPPGALLGKLGFSGSRLTVDAKGRVRVALTCSSAGPCTGSLVLVAASGRVVPARATARRAVTYGKASFGLAAGAKRTITVTLGSTARKRLKARHAKGLGARLVLVPAGAKQRTVPVTLKAARR